MVEKGRALWQCVFGCVVAVTVGRSVARSLVGATYGLGAVPCQRAIDTEVARVCGPQSVGCRFHLIDLHGAGKTMFHRAGIPAGPLGSDA